jgi:hypothetical protein
MADPLPTADLFPWLPIEKVLPWVKLDPESAKVQILEDVRLGACEWIEDQRPDRRTTEEAVTTFDAGYRLKVAARLAISRLWARMDSPFGFVAFQELGAASILATDPDVKKLVGRPRPRVG